MEADYPSKNHSQKLAILDMEVWIDPDYCVVYQHYEKPIKSKRVISVNSAQSTSCKRSVHVRELVRRILNTSGRLDWESMVAPHLTTYLGRMMLGGYNEQYRRVVLERALAIFDTMKKQEENGTQPINRPKEWNIAARRIEKRKKRRNWATRGGFIAPIIIPSTPDSELLKMMREVAQSEAETGLKFRIEERGGVTVKNQLQRSNPTDTRGCADDRCLGCQGGTVGGPMLCTS